MNDNLKTALIVASVTAVATLGGALGGQLLASGYNLKVTREQLRHDDRRHVYDLRQSAYVRMEKAASQFERDIGRIPDEKRSTLAPELGTDVFVAGRASDELQVIGSDQGAEAAFALVKGLDAWKWGMSESEVDDFLRGTTKKLYEDFLDAARADLRSTLG